VYMLCVVLTHNTHKHTRTRSSPANCLKTTEKSVYMNVCVCVSEGVWVVVCCAFFCVFILMCTCTTRAGKPVPVALRVSGRADLSTLPDFIPDNGACCLLLTPLSDRANEVGYDELFHYLQKSQKAAVFTSERYIVYICPQDGANLSVAREKCLLGLILLVAAKEKPSATQGIFSRLFVGRS